MSRKIARENILKFLFSVDFNKDQNLDEMLQLFFNNEQMVEDKDEEHEVDLNDRDREFCFDIIKGTLEHIDNIDNIIQKNAIGWKKNRIAKVDLAILRFAIFEIVYRDDIPDSVSANEAIELAKKYSSEESGKFVNGILGSIIKNKNQTGNCGLL